jgi:hypothetical protein
MQNSNVAVDIVPAVQFLSVTPTCEEDRLAKRAIRLLFAIGLVRLRAESSQFEFPRNLTFGSMSCLMAIDLLREQKNYPFFNAPPKVDPDQSGYTKPLPTVGLFFEPSGSMGFGTSKEDRIKLVNMLLDEAESALKEAESLLPAGQPVANIFELGSWKMPSATDVEEAIDQAYRVAMADFPNSDWNRYTLQFTDGDVDPTTIDLSKFRQLFGDRYATHFCLRSQS